MTNNSQSILWNIRALNVMIDQNETFQKHKNILKHFWMWTVSVCPRLTAVLEVVVLGLKELHVVVIKRVFPAEYRGLPFNGVHFCLHQSLHHTLTSTQPGWQFKKPKQKKHMLAHRNISHLTKEMQRKLFQWVCQEKGSCVVLCCALLATVAG